MQNQADLDSQKSEKHNARGDKLKTERYPPDIGAVAQMKGDTVCALLRGMVDQGRKDSQLIKYDIITPIATYK